MSKGKKSATISFTENQMDRYLDSIGLLHIFELEEVSKSTTQLYDKLQELFNTNFPETFPARIKPSSKYFFNSREDFNKQFFTYLKKGLLEEFWEMQVTHPKMSADEVSQRVNEDHVSIFNRAVANVYNDISYDIKTYKIELGQQPFANEFFSE